jgi:flagellar protein FlaF
MNTHAQARNAYGAAATPTRTNRDMEYALFAKITHRMSVVDESDKSDFPALASAVYDNQRLWMALAEDLMHEGNVLPVQLRAQLIGLAEFVRKHSLRVLGGNGSVAPLIDINTSIMRGLRGEAEVTS